MARKLIVEIIGDSSSLQRSFSTASRSTQKFSRDLSHAERGVLSGSGVFRSLGRSLAFASGGFLAFGGAAAFVRNSVDAAKDAQVANAQLSTQLASTGKSFETYRQQIDRTVSRLSALAGIQDDDLKAGLTTILRTVPNVSKALRDLGTAADLSRAKHISLAQAALIIAKTEGGNTTLLRRQGFQIAKNATVEEALAKLRQKVAGQARAGTTEQERFGAVLHQTEVQIGNALLPTLNKYLASGSKWLQQMNESGKLQRDVSAAANDFKTGMHDLSVVVKTVDRITGGFKNTLELLIGLKVASKFVGMAASVATFAGEIKTARLATLGLGGALGALSAPLTVAIGGLAFLFEQIREDAQKTQTIARAGQNSVIRKDGQFFKLTRTAGRGPSAERLQPLTVQEAAKIAQTDVDTLLAAFSKAKPDTGFRAPAITAALTKAADDATAKVVADRAARAAFTSNQNKFFDNAIARILLRGGLGDLRAQLAALDKAKVLLTQRLAATKDVTRRLNLEDQILELSSRRKDTLAQIAQAAKDAVDARAQAVIDAREKAQAAAEKRIAAITAKEFRQLGLTAQGDVPTPGVTNLKKRLSQITAAIEGTTLDTPKLESQLKRFRKVLSEGLVPKDVRAKIKEMMDGISDQLKNAGTGNQFRKVSSLAIIKSLGLDLTPAEVRRLSGAIAGIGPGGTVPGSHTAAFAGAGTVVVPVSLDGKVITTVVSAHQDKRGKRVTTSRRGPYAGRH